MAKHDRYVVGYKGNRHVVYGRDNFASTNGGAYRPGAYVEKMTEYQAKIASKELRSDATIYRLQPMKLVDGKLVPDESE